MKELKSKKVNLGKIDYYGHGRKINKVEVELALRQTDKGPVFTACGLIWNGRGTDCLSCGQNLDEINEYIHSDVFSEIYRLWKLYHLNDLHAGTKKQEEFVNKTFKEANESYNYNKACEILEEAGLLIDNGYKYGSGWLYEPIPEDDLKQIEGLINN